ncbi:MAG: flagellar export chaperone FliS [Bdellovibrionales bacterium]|nr:flagellar export chaperone FliS [Bdellovibrionales bacterium]
MYSKKAHKQYTNVHVSTVDRGRLLLMLYDGCTKFLKHAKAGLESKDIPKFARFLSKAQAIISELMLTLDFEKGGDVAKDLDRLYDFMLFYLTEANLEKNPDKLQKVIELVDVIASAYREVIEGETRKAAAETTDSAEPSEEGPRQPGGLSVAL